MGKRGLWVDFGIVVHGGRECIGEYGIVVARRRIVACRPIVACRRRIVKIGESAELSPPKHCQNMPPPPKSAAKLTKKFFIRAKKFAFWERIVLLSENVKYF